MWISIIVLILHALNSFHGKTIVRAQVFVCRELLPIKFFGWGNATSIYGIWECHYTIGSKSRKIYWNTFGTATRFQSLLFSNKTNITNKTPILVSMSTNFFSFLTHFFFKFQINTKIHVKMNLIHHIRSANQMTSFYMKCNAKLKQVKIQIRRTSCFRWFSVYAILKCFLFETLQI